MFLLLTCRLLSHKNHVHAKILSFFYAFHCFQPNKRRSFWHVSFYGWEQVRVALLSLSRCRLSSWAFTGQLGDTLYGSSVFLTMQLFFFSFLLANVSAKYKRRSGPQDDKKNLTGRRRRIFPVLSCKFIHL